MQSPDKAPEASAAVVDEDDAAAVFVRSPSPETRASFPSRLLLLWIVPLVFKGWRAPLADADLAELADEERGAATTARLKAAWASAGRRHDAKAEKARDKADGKARRRALGKDAAGQDAEDGDETSLQSQSEYDPTVGRLARSVFDTNRATLLATGVLKALDIALAALQPVMINRLLRFLSPTSTAPASRGYLFALALFAMPLLKTLVENHYFLKTMRAGMRVRSALQGMLYEKSLTMSPAARATATVGEVVNLMQLDAQRGADFFQFVHVLWGAPVQIVVTVALLYIFIGPSSLVGLAITLLTVPLQGWLMTIAMRLRARGVGVTDQRVKMMNEVLQGIKAVKFYAWEKPFMDKVTTTRAEELKIYAKSIVVRSAFVTLMMVIPTIIAVVTFSLYATLLGNELLPERVFTGIALLNQLRTPVMMLPMVFTSAIDAKLAFKRIERFLGLEDIENYGGRPDPLASRTPGGGGDDDADRGDGKKIIAKSSPPPVIAGTGTNSTSTTPDTASDSNWSDDPPELSSTLGDTEVSESIGVASFEHGAAAARVLIQRGAFGWGQPGEPLQPRENKKKKDKKKNKTNKESDGSGRGIAKCLPGKRAKKEEEASDVVGASQGGADGAGDGDGGQGEPETGTEHQDSEERPVVSPNEPFLRGISLDLRPGELTAIVGRVGSGKTSLVNAILGEMKKMGGVVRVKGRIAFVAQSAWIFNDTLRNNILFGNKYDEKRYRQAVRVSALEPDIAILPSGDETAIGEKGINLSGGQKQRVSIARAIYADADLYVFDDPLSALDSHVGQTVFDDCISNSGVLSSKLRIFVTNQLQVLPNCDKVLFMEKGCIRGAGPYEDLLTDASFRQLVEEVAKAEEEDQDIDGANVLGDVGPGIDSIGAAAAVSASAAAGVGEGGMPVSDSMSKTISAVTRAADSRAESGDAPGPAVSASASKADAAESKDDGKQLMTEEERETGSVLLGAYYRYAVACGGVFRFFLILLLFIVSVALSVIVNWWLAFWSQETAGDGDSRTAFYLSIYFGLGVLYAVLTFLRNVFYLTSALRASKSLHEIMLCSVLRAPMSFFDTTPIGRIISRFARDVNAVDQLLPQMFSQMLATVLNLLASYIFIATVFPLFITVAVPITILYFLLQRFYNRSSIELKRLDSISKSPIYAGFSETLGGLSTIRAYNKQLQFQDENMEKIDVNQRAYFASLASNRWFSLYLEICGSVLVFATALFAVIMRSSSSKSAASVGLSLTYALQVTGILGFTIRSITELELQMNSVERLDHYGKKLDQEKPAIVEKGNPIADGELWPSAGEIDIRDAQMRYRPGLDLVLKGISLKIPAGSKVGIVGRTGSGKSSLMLVLLRLVELAGGSIAIDGKDVSQLGLDDVRGNITIIPQDAVLFSGTVRFNLDPFGTYSEPELWDALAKSYLKEFVEDFDGGLDALVSEYGENLSAGQRQLICLTRALLRKSKVLIMDEASSSLDYETDRLLQESIQQNMAGATILTIAHRLWTLTKCDKILVMSDGVASEFDTPEALLAKPDSELRRLVDAMGEDGATRFAELVDENAKAMGRL